MTVNTTSELVESYVNLLIMQYLGKPKAAGTISLLSSLGIIPQTSIQTISFSQVPTSGSYILSYDGDSTSSILWSATSSDLQTALRLLTGLSSVTVTGDTSTGFTVTFTGVDLIADILVVESNLLFATSSSVSITIAEIDETTPLAVMNGFNILDGFPIAVGNQLDTIGKYAGVTRTGLGFSGTATITLDDSDFLSLIRMAIIKNNSGSSLSDIAILLNQFFPDEVFAYDNADMTMTYIISQAVGSQDLVQLFVTEGLLPAPMAVKITTYYPPSAYLFSFRTATAPSPGAPFSTAADPTIGHWLSATEIIT